MQVFRKENSKYWWYDFTIRGRRYRGSAKETNENRAIKIASLKLAAAMDGSDPINRKPPTLRQVSERFLEWIKTARLEPDSRRYYENGWRLLQQTGIPGVRLDRISTDGVEALHFPGSPANGNNALRTLRRMLNKARDWKLVREVPRFKLFKEAGRALRLDDVAEQKLLAVAEQPLRDIIVLMRDTGMRNARELYRMRIENIHWEHNLIFNPDSKTPQGRRWIPMSKRVTAILRGRCEGRREGWVFPSVRKGKHITGGLVNKQWVRARQKAGLPESLGLYSARHDFGSYLLQSTGNLKAVMETMGHADVKTAMKYQHPEMQIVRDALNSRHILRHTG